MEIVIIYLLNKLHSFREKSIRDKSLLAIDLIFTLLLLLLFLYLFVSFANGIQINPNKDYIGVQPTLGSWLYHYFNTAGIATIAIVSIKIIIKIITRSNDINVLRDLLLYMASICAVFIGLTYFFEGELNGRYSSFLVDAVTRYQKTVDQKN